jgi:transposase
VPFFIWVLLLPCVIRNVIKTFYERLVERGKPKKLAITACVHKMLVILNAMIRDHLPWSISQDSQPISA